MRRKGSIRIRRRIKYCVISSRKPADIRLHKNIVQICKKLLDQALVMAQTLDFVQSDKEALERAHRELKLQLTWLEHTQYRDRWQHATQDKFTRAPNACIFTPEACIVKAIEQLKLIPENDSAFHASQVLLEQSMLAITRADILRCENEELQENIAGLTDDITSQIWQNKTLEGELDFYKYEASEYKNVPIDEFMLKMGTLSYKMSENCDSASKFAKYWKDVAQHNIRSCEKYKKEIEELRSEIKKHRIEIEELRIENKKHTILSMEESPSGFTFTII
jgi:hypothetical protein